MAEKRKQNTELKGQVDALDEMLAEEVRVQGSATVNQAAEDTTMLHKRMRSLVTQARLRDIAQAQAQEVALLQGELERLRLRTFPSFVPRPDDLPDERPLGAVLAQSLGKGSTLGKSANLSRVAM